MPISSNKPLVIPIFIPYSGCPHRCVFCNQAALTGSTTPIPDPVEIKNIITRFLQFKKPFRKPIEVSFFGGNFLGLDPKIISTLMAPVIPFLERVEIDSVRFSTRPDTITEKTLSLIEQYPVSCIELGVQSMDDAILARCRRGHTSADTKNAVALIKKRGYGLGLQVMVGLPGETREVTMSTGAAIAALKPDFVRIYPTLVIADSALAAWYKNGKYTPLCLDECIDRVKALYLMFTAKNIRVIRMGLQANEELDSGAAVLAGPYHPAFGHMVLSEIMLDKVKSAINQIGDASRRLLLSVHPSCVSRMQGLKKNNLDRLKKEFGFKEIQIIADPLVVPDHVVVS
ncbi:MAG: radical SAM protein [Deltaproteobacteria bacterium]|nr:radical SAM protein [Deltaproteobacteria bacterium]